MLKITDLVQAIKPYVLNWIQNIVWVNGSDDTYQMAVLDGRCLAFRATLNSDVSQGMVLQFSQSVDGTVEIAAANSDLPIGVAYSDGVKGQRIWVVYNGFAQVLFKTGVTGTKGYVVYVSDTAGYADNSSSLPSTAQHNREFAHCFKDGTSGGLAMCHISHMN